MLSGFVTLLLAYHLAYLWARPQPGGSQRSLPTSYQYFLTMSLVDNPRLIRVFDSVKYIFTNRRSRHKALSPIFILAFAGAFLVTTLSWTIKAVDLVLHDRIVPTTLWSARPDLNLRTDAAIVDGCLDPRKPLCPVVNRTNEARLGGLNQSTTFHVYPYDEHTNSTVGSLAFIIPASLPTNNSIHNGHTYAAATTCQVYHPICFVDQMKISECGPDPSYGLDAFPLYTNFSFDVANIKWNMQTFLLKKGDIDMDPHHVPLSNGANVNPLNFATWSCFDDYADIKHDDTNNAPFQGPFINWWQYGQGIGNKPFKLCSITFCNTSFYDGTYSGYHGNWTLDVDNLHPADNGTALTLSGAAVFLGTADSDLYVYTSNYMDEMLQVDLSAAGNTYGNDSAAFAGAWGQSISARLLGWSAGAVELVLPTTGTAMLHQGSAAVSIDLASAYAFTGLLFTYAVLIVILGISCAFIPTSRIAPASSQPGTSGARPVSNTRAAHAKLSDFSTLVMEVLDAREVGRLRPTLSRRSSAVSLGEAGDHAVERQVRLGLRTKADGGLGLDFHD
jgi:hypothetical protein